MSSGEIQYAQTWPAGWYPDPDKEAPFRYWNGERWTERRRDRRPINARLIAGWGAAAAAVVGSIGPWATLGILRVNGLDNGRDGMFTLVAAVVAALAIAAYHSRPSAGSAIMTSILGLVITAIAVIDIKDIASRSTTVFGESVSPDPGWGIVLTMIAGGILVIAGVMLLSARPRAQRG